MVGWLLFHVLAARTVLTPGLDGHDVLVLECCDAALDDDNAPSYIRCVIEGALPVLVARLVLVFAVVTRKSCVERLRGNWVRCNKGRGGRGGEKVR